VRYREGVCVRERAKRERGEGNAGRGEDPMSHRRSPRSTGRGRLAGEVDTARWRISESPFPRAASCSPPRIIEGI
jgi:hypothetical protein